MLDVGCGEGVLTVEWAERLGDGRVVGIDLDDPKLRAEWEKRTRPNLEFRAEEATRLSFGDDEFDMAAAIEVLEHVPDPEATLAEMARVARRHLLVSVPREPLWRGLNMARGAYLRDLGNTPGHVNHWSKRASSRCSRATGRSRRPARRSRGPCCLSASAEASPGSYGRGRGAVLSVGIGVTGLITFAYFSLASHSLAEDEYGRITLLWSAIFITVSVLYRPVEQLLSRTIADHDARGIAGTQHLRVAAHDPARARRSLFAVVALALRGPIQDDLFGGSATLYWVLVVAVLAYAASYFARGFLAGHHQLRPLRRARAHGGQLALPVRARGGDRDRRGPDGGRARDGGGADRVARGGAAGARRGGSRDAGPPTSRRRPARRRGRATSRRRRRARVHARARHRLRGRGAADHALRADLPERRPAADRGDARAPPARRSPASSSTCC